MTSEATDSEVADVFRDFYVTQEYEVEAGIHNVAREACDEARSQLDSETAPANMNVYIEVEFTDGRE